MAITEVFSNPTVVQVAFEIRFPNLFSMENLIGDYQTKIMARFPDSALLIRRNIFMALGPETEIGKLAQPETSPAIGKLWKFTSEDQVEVVVATDSLSVVSKSHKSYNNPTVDRFRDMVQYALDPFLGLTRVPLLHRVGLRYTDDCPIPAKANTAFLAWYNSAFPLDRFALEDAEEMVFQTVAKRGDHQLRYVESLQKSDDAWKYTIDFDAAATKVPAGHYLTVADQLHQIVADEYERTMRSPVLEHMRRSK